MFPHVRVMLDSHSERVTSVVWAALHSPVPSLGQLRVFLQEFRPGFGAGQFAGRALDDPSFAVQEDVFDRDIERGGHSTPQFLSDGRGINAPCSVRQFRHDHQFLGAVLPSDHLDRGRHRLTVGAHLREPAPGPLDPGPGPDQPNAAQLVDGGIMIVPVGDVGRDQRVLRVERQGGDYKVDELWTVRFVPLVPQAPPPMQPEARV